MIKKKNLTTCNLRQLQLTRILSAWLIFISDPSFPSSVRRTRRIISSIVERLISRETDTRQSALTSTKSSGQVSYPRVWILLEASIKGCCRLLRKTFLSLSLSSPLPFAGRLQKFQYIKCSLSSRRGETKRRWFRKRKREWSAVQGGG